MSETGYSIGPNGIRTPIRTPRSREVSCAEKVVRTILLTLATVAVGYALYIGKDAPSQDCVYNYSVSTEQCRSK